MNSPAEDIKDFLVDAIIGTFNTDLYTVLEPEEHNNDNPIMTVYDSGGFDPEAAYEYDRPTVQIRVRGAAGGYVAAYTKAQAIKAELNGKNNETKNGARYVGIWQQGEILSLGMDESNRPILTLNFRIHRVTAP